MVVLPRIQKSTFASQIIDHKRLPERIRHITSPDFPGIVESLDQFGLSSGQTDTFHKNLLQKFRLPHGLSSDKTNWNQRGSIEQGGRDIQMPYLLPVPCICDVNVSIFGLNDRRVTELPRLILQNQNHFPVHTII